MVQEQTVRRRNTTSGLGLAAVTGMGLFGWSHLTPFRAQEGQVRATATQPAIVKPATAQDEQIYTTATRPATD